MTVSHEIGSHLKRTLSNVLLHPYDLDDVIEGASSCQDKVGALNLNSSLYINTETRKVAASQHRASPYTHKVTSISRARPYQQPPCRTHTV